MPIKTEKGVNIDNYNSNTLTKITDILTSLPSENDYDVYITETAVIFSSSIDGKIYSKQPKFKAFTYCPNESNPNKIKSLSELIKLTTEGDESSTIYKYVIDFKNEYAPLNIQIKKVDKATNKPLKDAEFTITTKENEVYKLVTTGDVEKDIITIPHTESVHIEETKFPPGYIAGDAFKQDYVISDFQQIKESPSDLVATKYLLSWI